MGALHEVLDIVQPREFVRNLSRGSWILLQVIAGWLLAGLKWAMQQSGKPDAPAPKPTAKTSLQKADSPDGEEEGDGQEAAKQSAKLATAARTGGDRMEQAALAAIVCAVALGAVGGFGSILMIVLQPYMKVGATVVVLGWIAAALTVDLVTRPEDDHEENPGEQPQEEEVEESVEAVEEMPQEEPWEVVRERLRRFVEERVAAGAGGHGEGIKGKGARVDDLLAEQQENGGLPGMQRKGMIELLERAGITVREQMNFRVLEETAAGWKWKQKNVPGVHVEDLTQNLGRRPRLPAHLVPSIGPNGAPLSPPDPAPVSAPALAHIPAQESAPVPLPRAAGE